VERAVEVRGQDAAPIGRVDRGNRCQAGRNAGVRDDDVQLAEFGDGRRNHRLDGGVVRDISLQCDRAPPHCAHFCRRRFGRVTITTIVDRDVRAFARELEHDAAPDATTAAGHERCFAREAVHARSFDAEPTRARPTPRARS
jgi:hypothetical protein